jgi:pimeloyl-ACP methyl ester carboxylesterase
MTQDFEEWEWSSAAGSLRGLSQSCAGGPNVLSIHGWLDNAASFAPLVRELKGFNHVMVDLPGHGLSDWLPPGLVYHFIDWIAWLVQLIECKFDGPVILLGHSMGAGIAPIVASASPERISHLILLDGLGPLSSQAESAPTILREALAKPLETKKSRPFESRSQVAQVLARARQLQPDQLSDLAIRAVNESITDGVSQFYLRHDPRLKLPSRLRITEEQTRAFLAELETPTLLINPSRGYFNQEESWMARTPLMKRLTISDIEGGHHAHLEHPKQIAELINSWLSQPSPQS